MNDLLQKTYAPTTAVHPSTHKLNQLKSHATISPDINATQSCCGLTNEPTRKGKNPGPQYSHYEWIWHSKPVLKRDSRGISLMFDRRRNCCAIPGFSTNVGLGLGWHEQTNRPRPEYQMITLLPVTDLKETMQVYHHLGPRSRHR